MEGFCVVIVSTRCSSPTPNLRGFSDTRFRGLTEPLFTNFSQISFTVFPWTLYLRPTVVHSSGKCPATLSPPFKISSIISPRTDSSRNFPLEKKRPFDRAAPCCDAVNW